MEYWEAATKIGRVLEAGRTTPRQARMGLRYCLRMINRFFPQGDYSLPAYPQLFPEDDRGYLRALAFCNFNRIHETEYRLSEKTVDSSCRIR